jgi:hypothetical protein
MAWIAFASVPAALVLMLAMGQLEARLLPRTPPPNGAGDPIGAVDAGHRTWVIRYVQPDTGARADAGGTSDGREEART